MIERILIYHKRNDPITEMLIKKVLQKKYPTNVEVFFINYFDLLLFKKTAFSNNVDLIVTHCHDSTRNHEIIIKTVNDVVRKLPNCTVVLTIDSLEDLKSYERELLNKYHFDYLVGHYFYLEIIPFLNSISKNKKPFEKLIYISENEHLPFKNTLGKI